MIKHVYARRDDVMNFYTNVVLEPHEPSEFKEILRRTVSDPKVPKSALRSSMIKIGEFDDVSGKLTTCEPLLVCNFMEFESVWDFTHGELNLKEVS